MAAARSRSTGSYNSARGLPTSAARSISPIGHPRIPTAETGTVGSQRLGCLGAPSRFGAALFFNRADSKTYSTFRAERNRGGDGAMSSVGGIELATMSDVSSTLPLGPRIDFDSAALVGTLLDGRYRLVAHVATGGMGAVFEAVHVRLERRIAIKVLRPDLAQSREMTARFRREARIYGSLEHPNIVRVVDFGRTPEGVLFLVMEYLEGESLRARLEREGALRLEEALPILVDVAS